MRRLDELDRAVILLALLASTSVTASSSVCYYPDGQSEHSLIYQPCPISNGDGASMCCATNRTNPSGGSLSDGPTADMCLESGLCMNAGKHKDGTAYVDYWRDQCTSSDWASGGCLDVCTSGTNGTSSGTAQMTPCDGTEDSEYWCCGLLNTACCGTSDAISIPAKFGQKTTSSASISTTSTSSASSTSTSLTASTTSTTSTTPPISTVSSSSDFHNPTDSEAVATSSSTDSHHTTTPAKGLSTGSIVGIGVGVGVGTISLSALILFYMLWQRKSPLSSYKPNMRHFGIQQPRELDSNAPLESEHDLTETSFTNYIMSPQIRHELPGDSIFRK